MSLIQPGSSPVPERQLFADEVHVWLADLTTSHQRLLQLQSSLSPAEQDRAGRFVSSTDRDRYIAAHGWLRQLLASYADSDPAQLLFAFGPFGKPRLIQPESAIGLEFNLSHSHQHALLGISHRRQIGVDLEWIRPELAFQTMAERFFAPGEIRMLNSIPVSGRTEAFYLCWTRKEAYTKARGLGLSLPLDQFEVSLLPDHPPQLLAAHDPPDPARHWTLHDLTLPDGYAGAVAVEGPGSRLVQFRMDLK